MRTKLAAVLSAALIGASAAGCVYEPTEVLVLVATDLPVDQPLTIRVTVRDGSERIAAGSQPDQEWNRARGMIRPRGPDAGIDLPASFAIVPREGGARDGAVSVLVEGVSGSTVLRRNATFTFVPRQAWTLRVFLTARCALPDDRCMQISACTRQSFCEERGMTCGDFGDCVPVSGMLQRDGGSFDVSPFDAPRDTPRDTPVPPRDTAPEVCTANCSGAVCGAPNGCGGTCNSGSCGGNETCNGGTCECSMGFARCGAACLPTADVVCVPGQSHSQGCGACGTQTGTCNATCQWDPFGTCSGGGVCSPGQTQSQACGNCGSQSAACNNACQWDPFGACGAEGPCAPGQTRTQACGNCGSQTSTCGATCQWGAFGACGGQGPCTPGAAQAGGCDACSRQVCSAACQWNGCSLRPGNACESRGGTNSRACGACRCGLQWCLPSCAWSTGCTSCCTSCGGCL